MTSYPATLNLFISCNSFLIGSSLLFSHWFSIWMIHPLLKVGYGSTQLLLHCCVFLPSVLLYFLYVFSWFNVGCIYIYHFYSFDDWPLDHYIVTFFVSCNRFDLRPILSDLSIATPGLCGYHLHKISLSIPPLLNFSMSVKLTMSLCQKQGNF